MPLITENFENFMHLFRPHMAPQGVTRYPTNVAHPANFVGPNETAHQMLQRVVHDFCGGDVEQVAVEPNLAVIAIVVWDNYNHIERASIQAIKTDVDLDAIYHAGGHPTHRYFRFDLDNRAGRLFTHPYPHVHFVPRETQTRCSLNGWQSLNPVMDFFEHVYIECFYDEWLDWARSLWNSYWAHSHPGEPNPFQRIVEAFLDSNHEEIELFQPRIDRLKAILSERKDEAYRLRCNGVRRDIAAYP